MLDTIAPPNRVRAIAFVAAFPDFWPLIEDTTRTTLQTTVDNTTAATLTDFRVLSGLALANFRGPLEAAIAGLDRDRLVQALSAAPLVELWPKAVEEYGASRSWRGSEENFRLLISPFAGTLTAEQSGELLDAIIGNSQNWDAGDTSTPLFAFLRNTPAVAFPHVDARNRFYHHLRRHHRGQNYADVLTALQSDGWAPGPAPVEDDD